MVEFKLPDLGEGIHEAEILDIRVKVGDMVKSDQILFEVETDKAAVEVPSPYEGKVDKIFFKVGDVAKVGNPMISIATADEPVNQEKAKPESVPEAVPVGARGASAKTANGGNGKAATAPGPAAPQMKAAPTTGPVPATPATRKMARDLNIDLRLVPASGPGGRVLKEDVTAFADGGGTAAPAASSSRTPSTTRSAGASVAARFGGEGNESTSGGPLTLQPVELPDFSKYGKVERVPLRSLRKKIATSMAQSWSHVPRVSNFDEADITDLEAMRQKHEKRVAEQGGKLTLTAIALKAVVSGLRKYPQFNASLDEATSEIIFKHYYNIGIAVATDRGLIVPVIRDVDQKNLVELSIELADLAKKTRDGKIEVERLQGGTFTITNIGPIGGTGMVPMVNHPEVAIMGMARSQEKPVVRNGQIVVRNILPLALSFDHRVGDGAEAAMMLHHIAACLEDPFELLLEG